MGPTKKKILYPSLSIAIPFISPFSLAAVITELRPFAQIRKMKCDKGSPYLNLIVGVIHCPGFPLTNTEYLTIVTHFMINPISESPNHSVLIVASR